jgi:hypothetical protein
MEKKDNQNRLYASQAHAKRNFISKSNRYLSDLRKLYADTPKSENIEDVIWILYLIEAQKSVRQAVTNTKATLE